MFSALVSRTSFRDKTVVVTGASAGIGRAVAARFAREGARLGLIARDEAALAEVKAELGRLGAKVAIAPADVSDAGAVFEAAARFERELGPIEVWVNAAMVTVFSPVASMSPEEVRRVTEVTYLGFVHGTMAALRHMRTRNRGTIVQVGSALAYRGIPLQAAYCGAKFAIRGFTESLRTELMHDRSKVRVSMVQLPGINTPQFDWARTHLGHQPRPVAPVLEPEVPAAAVVRAAREGCTEYWLGKTTVMVILGNMLCPSGIARYLARTGFSGQQTEKPVSASRPDNLMHPVPGYHRTRGSFSDEAGTHAVLVPAWAARWSLLFAGTAVTAGLGFLAGRLSRPR